LGSRQLAPPRESRCGPEGSSIPALGGEALQRTARAGGKDDPKARCLPQGLPKVNTLPYPFKIMNMPGDVVILYDEGVKS